MNDLSKAELIELKARESVIQDKEGYVFDEDYKEPEKKKGNIENSITYIVEKNRKRRKKMNSRLLSWGEWINGGRQLSNGATFEGIGGDGDFDGYDHCILTDFDSLMISIEAIVMSLNPDENKFIHDEYEIIAGDRIQAWCDESGLSATRYRTKKSAIILKLSIKLEVETANKRVHS